MMKSLRYDRVMVITLAVALFSMAIGLSILTGVKAQLVRVSTADYKQQQELTAGQIAETLSNNFVNIENQLKLIATIPEVKNLDDVEQCNNKLDEILKINQKQVGNLARVDADGFFRCSVNRSLIGQNSTQYGSYIMELIQDSEHRPVLGRVTKPKGANTFAVGMHVPVYEGDAFKGTLGGAIYFDQFQDVYLREIKFGRSGHAVLVDDNGDILYHPSKEQNGKNLLDPKILSLFEPQEVMRSLLKDVQEGKSGTFDYMLQGTKKSGIYKTFKVPNINRHWSVVVTIPSEDLNHAVNQAGINRIFIILVLLFSLTTTLLTFIGLRNIIKNREVQRMKDDFISITSHQLRTPATIVKQSLGLIKGGFVKNKKDKDRFIDSAYESNENQLSIIENILSLSKLEAGRLEVEKEPIVLQEFINKIAATMKMSLAAKGHKLTVKMPPEIIRLKADPTKLTMALENLISNGVKYTPAKGKITIKASSTEDDVLIAVTDNGKGISEKDISQLFQRFNRLNSAVASHVPGTGLGLYMTKKIIELHGGSITVQSKEKVGSTFTVKIPLG